jgi:hypothetical protein
MTRCVREKRAQNVAKPILRQNDCTTVTVVKSSSKIRSIFAIFKNLPKLNDKQIGENSLNLATLAQNFGHFRNF